MSRKNRFDHIFFTALLQLLPFFYLLVLTLAGRVIYLLWCLRIPDVPHGILFLIASLCLPPTILIIMAMRSLLEHKHEDKKEENKMEDFSPILKLVNEILKVTHKA